MQAAQTDLDFTLTTLRTLRQDVQNEALSPQDMAIVENLQAENFALKEQLVSAQRKEWLPENAASASKEYLEKASQVEINVSAGSPPKEDQIGAKTFENRLLRTMSPEEEDLSQAHALEILAFHDAHQEKLVHLEQELQVGPMC